MKRTKKNYRQRIIYAMVFGVVLVVGYLLFKMQAKSSQVALVSEGGSDVGSCLSNLLSFAGSGACGVQGFSTYSYSCLDGQTKPLETPNTRAGVSCIDFSQAYAKAATICGSTCKPTPSCVPNPCLDDRVCRLTALPDGQVYCPRQSSSPYPSPTPPPGPQCDRQTITHHQLEEPCGGGDTPPGYKVIQFRCGSDSSSPLSAASFKDPNNNNQCVSEDSLVNKAKNLCLDLTCASPIPSTPTPTPSPGCYYEEPTMCVQLFGYECKSKLVCSTPSTKPSESPHSSSNPISSIEPSKQPIIDPAPIRAPKQKCYKLWRFQWCRRIKH